MSKDYFLDKDGDFNALSLVILGWNKKIAIIIATILFGIGGFFYSNFLDETWTARTTLIPTEASQAGPAGARASTLINLTGVSLGGAVGVSNAQLAQELMVSRDFFKRLISDEFNLINLMAMKKYEDGSPVYDPDIYDSKKNQWILKPDFFPAYRVFRSGLEIDYSWDKGGFINVSFTHKSPVFAAQFLNTIINEVNTLKRDKDIEQAEAQLEYLIVESRNATNADLKRALSGLMQNQLKSKMFAKTRDFYLVEPLDSVYEPALRTTPQRRLITLIFLILGFSASFIYVTVKKFLE
jgi:LPS O-antigen subunit length determinant protein (WzzB/FepE family)